MLISFAKLSNIIENCLTNRLQLLGYHTETYNLAISFAASGILNFMISQIKQILPETKQMICFTYNELIYAILKHKVKTSSVMLPFF